MSDDNNQHKSVVTNVVIFLWELVLQSSINKNIKAYLTKEEFNYTMNLIDSKINALYKFCKYISEWQKENTKALNRLVALDELSDNF